MRLSKIWIAIGILLLIPKIAGAFEVYDNTGDRLFGVKWCNPVSDNPSDGIKYIACDAASDEQISASKQSLCTNYQDGCAGSPETVPVYSQKKTKKPWNYFDISEPASVKQPSSYQPAIKMNNAEPDDRILKKKGVPVKKD
jgi:hypothetical protein